MPSGPSVVPFFSLAVVKDTLLGIHFNHRIHFPITNEMGDAAMLDDATELNS